MSVLVVGISHKTAPLPILERVALDAEGVHKLIREITDSDYVTEATVLSTCNRTEVYADVERFHGSVEAISRMIGDRAGKTPEEVLEHLYVHYDDGAVSHLFHVAAGLDSMVLGESQILGQTREALRVGQEAGTVGPALNVLFQQALRVGKRSHAETDIDRVAPAWSAAALSPRRRARRRPRRQARRGRRRRVDGAPDRGDRLPRRCRLDRGGQPDPRAGGPPGRPVRRPRDPPQRARQAVRPGRRARLVHGRGRGPRRRRRRHLRAAPPTARWRSSTWPCRMTWTPRWPTCPAYA